MIKKNKILVVGDVILDIFTYGKFLKKSPEANIPAIDNRESRFFSLGGAANVCSNIVSLGCETSLIHFQGYDKNSNKIKKFLKDKKINDLSVKVRGFDITTKERIFSNFSPILRIDNDTKYKLKLEHFNKLKFLIEKNIFKFDLIIISDYQKGVCINSVIKFLIKKSNKLKIPVFVDPNPMMLNLKMYSNAYCIKPNFNEAKNFYKKLQNNKKSLKKVALKLINKININKVIITRGDRGAFICSKKKSEFFQLSKKKIADVTGAGDTFIATLAVYFLKTKNLFSACKYANKASYISVSHRGTYSIDKKKL